MKRVKEIFKNLENDSPFVSKSELIDEKKKLIARAAELEQIRHDLIESLREIKESEVYQTILNIDDWNSHFEDIKQQLESELQTLEEIA